VRWLASYRHLRYLRPALAAAAEMIILHRQQAVAAYLGGERLGVVVRAVPAGGDLGERHPHGRLLCRRSRHRTPAPITGR
jgi:hypothetical protein